jgi:hypothetical protein
MTDPRRCKGSSSNLTSSEPIQPRGKPSIGRATDLVARHHSAIRQYRPQSSRRVCLVAKRARSAPPRPSIASRATAATPFRAFYEKVESEGDSRESPFVIQASHWTGGPAWMGKPYSEDLRRGIVQAIETGHTYEEAADLCGVSISSVSRFRNLVATRGTHWSPTGVGSCVGWMRSLT